jgi:hypothetical protein
MTIQKGDPRIVGAYKGKELPGPLKPLTEAVLGVLPEGYVLAPSMYGGEFPRVAVMIPGVKDPVMTATVDEELGTFQGLESVAALEPPAGSAPTQAVDAEHNGGVSPEPVNGGLAQSEVMTNPAPHSDMEVLPTPAKPKAPKKAAKPAAKKPAKAPAKKPVVKAKTKPAPKPQASPRKAAKAPKVPEARKVAPAPQAAPVAAPGGKVSKTAAVVALMERAQGATAADITEATGWLAHSIRGFVATLKTKRGLPVTSEKVDGIQVWKLAVEELV